MTINWKGIKISDFGQVVTGKTPQTKRSELYGKKYPFITPTDLKYGSPLPQVERGLSEEGFLSQRNILLPPKSVCFTCIGATIGKMCITRKPSFTNQQINSIIINHDKYDYWFVYNLLRTQIKKIKRRASGAATPIINKTAFSNIEVSVPPLPIQRKIAGILSAYDDLIENNTCHIKILENMAQLIYREWFVNFRYPGHEDASFVESKLGKIPDGWGVKTLEEISRRITDGSHWSPKSIDQGYPMASVKDMHNWGINIEKCRTISEEDFNKLVRNDCKPMKNDVLIAKDGSYLKHIFVTDEEISLVILSSIAIIRPNKLIKPRLLVHYLKQPNVKSRMAGFVTGAALPRIILKDFRKFLVLLPPMELQEKFNKLIEPMCNLCIKEVKENINLRQTRDLLLPKLISGKIDVSELDIDIGEGR